MSDSSDDMELYSGMCDDDDADLMERIERIEKIIIQLAQEITAGTGGKHKNLWPLFDSINRDLGRD